MVFTISLDLLENIDKSEIGYYYKILYQFPNEFNSFKVAKDKDGEIFNIYQNVTNNPEYIKVWLDFMANSSSSSFEKINVSIKDEDTDENKLKKLCSNVRGDKKMIVYSLQNISEPIDTDNQVEYNNVKIKLLDRDEATLILNSNSNTNININGDVNSSIVGGGDINNSNNN